MADGFLHGFGVAAEADAIAVRQIKTGGQALQGLRHVAKRAAGNIGRNQYLAAIVDAADFGGGRHDADIGNLIETHHQRCTVRCRATGCDHQFSETCQVGPPLGRQADDDIVRIAVRIRPFRHILPADKGGECRGKIGAGNAEIARRRRLQAYRQDRGYILRAGGHVHEARNFFHVFDEAGGDFFKNSPVVAEDAQLHRAFAAAKAILQDRDLNARYGRQALANRLGKGERGSASHIERHQAHQYGGAMFAGGAAGVDGGIKHLDLRKFPQRLLDLPHLGRRIVQRGADRRGDVDLEAALIGIRNEFRADQRHHEQAGDKYARCDKQGDEPVPQGPADGAAILAGHPFEAAVETCDQSAYRAAFCIGLGVRIVPDA
ncbi:hypothetical protein D3C86_1168560 [compost metagenome]